MFGEFEEMILYHSVLIQTMLGVLIVGMIIPFLSSACSKTIKRTRIYMFVSHALLSMMAFTGMIAFVFAKMEMRWDIGAMIVAFLVMIMVEVFKYKKILKAGTDEGCAKNNQMVAIGYTLLNILIISAFFLYEMVEVKSAIPTA